VDDASFDAIVRSLAPFASRRRALAGAAVGLLAAWAAATDDRVAAARKRRKKRCRGRKKRCGRRCRTLATNPRHCGRCGKRCQLNAVCAGGTCDCVEAGCGIEDASCCPAAAAGICACVQSDDPTPIITDPSTCAFIPIADCPVERRCVGPRCRACCPVGTTCDPGTGTCLR
jgi:hypothetical protein